MAFSGRSPLLVAIPLWMSLGSAEKMADVTAIRVPVKREANPVACEAFAEPEICYVLDGILFLYGIILTVLYCRIKLFNVKKAAAEKVNKQNTEEGIYTGLTPHAPDTYETIGMKK